MSFDPAQPADHSALASQVMREQLNALKALIDAQPTVASAAGRASAPSVPQGQARGAIQRRRWCRDGKLSVEC
ncbi:MAG TPA: hypothetical protein VFD27_07985 [Chthoniobacteraceae bacterium]|jgi:hypothetical protein|nr:hypothetical protein [Chthoniobacteraceae bacterium]